MLHAGHGAFIGRRRMSRRDRRHAICNIGEMARRRKNSTSFVRRIALALLAVPVAYLLAALIGSLIPVNSAWREPDRGISIYLADNGVHADLILPVRAAGLDWAPLLPRSDMADARPGMNWIAFGAGERRVY